MSICNTTETLRPVSVITVFTDRAAVIFSYVLSCITVIFRAELSHLTY